MLHSFLLNYILRLCWIAWILEMFTPLDHLLIYLPTICIRFFTHCIFSLSSEKPTAINFFHTVYWNFLSSCFFAILYTLFFHTVIAFFYMLKAKPKLILIFMFWSPCKNDARNEILLRDSMTTCFIGVLWRIKIPSSFSSKFPPVLLRFCKNVANDEMLLREIEFKCYTRTATATVFSSCH